MFFQCSFISSLTPQQEVEAYVKSLLQNDKEQMIALVNELVEQGHDQHSIEKIFRDNEYTLISDVLGEIIVAVIAALAIVFVCACGIHIGCESYYNREVNDPEAGESN